MKPLDMEAARKSAKADIKKEEVIDFSKVEIEPLFEEMVDFDTFSKSTMKPLDMEAARKSAKADIKKEEVIDFSKVEIEPLFEEMVDFDTFSKSDFRAVKIKDWIWKQPENRQRQTSKKKK